MSFETRQKAHLKVNNWWEWSVWIEGTSSELDSIQAVTYALHSTFPNRVRKITERSTKFRLDSGGWGGFRIRILLELKTGEKVRMSHKLELSYPERRESVAGKRRKRAPAICKVFISSSAADASVTALERIRQTLRENKITPTDISKLPLDAPIEVSIRNAIRNSDAVIAVRSAAPSAWVESEIAFARSYAIPVITVDALKREVSVESSNPLEAKTVAEGSSALYKLRAALAKTLKPSEDVRSEIIDFDSEAPEGREFLAFTTATGLSRFTDIPWPKGLAPKTGPKPSGDGSGPLPAADVLVVTWTVDEGHALSRVLTPGKDSLNDYVPYTHNFAVIKKKMTRKFCPALTSKRLGTYWTTAIGGKKVVVFKSDSHLPQDSRTLPKANDTLPIEDVWQQIIDEVKPKLVITTGTAGGIGPQFEVGDVVVSPIVRFHCLNWLKRAPFHDAIFTAGAPKTKFFAKAKELFKANADQLPKDNTRLPKIVQSCDLATSVLTTDFFAFDTSDNHYGLQGLGYVGEMGDAMLGLVASRMGTDAPRWIAVRNVSLPQIKAEGTLQQQAQVSAQIYKVFSRWSSVCSAIVCWALIAAE